MLNELAWSVGTLALALLVYRRTGSAIGSTGFFLCSQVVPAIASPALVAQLDRRAPNRLLPLLYGLEAGLFGILAWLTSRFALAPVLVLALLDGVVAIVARAMASAVRVQVLRPLDLVPEGNVVANGAFAVCFMAGPLIGGAVVVAGGTVAALLANCGLFAVMGLLLASAGLPHNAEAEHGPSTGRLRGALRHARADPGLSRLIVLQGIGLAVFTISIPVEVIYAQHTLHAGASGYGALLSAWGAGAIAGSVIIARFRRHSPRLLIGGSALALAIGFLVMTVAPTLAVAVAGAVIAGLGNGVESTAAQTAVQQRTGEEWMALIMSLLQSVTQLSPGAGIFLGGAIASVTSARAAFGVAGIGSLAFAILALIALRPSVLGDGAPPGSPPGGTGAPPAHNGASAAPASGHRSAV